MLPSIKAANVESPRQNPLANQLLPPLFVSAPHPCTMSKAIGALLGMAAAVLRPVYNATRSFYEDEPDVTSPNAETPAIVNGVTVRTAEPVEGAFKSAREALAGVYESTVSSLYEGRAQLQEKEQRVTRTMSSLHSRHEDLLPNALYIAIGALSGNIFARRRGIVVRAAAPVVFGVASFWYFLPQTFGNTVDFLWRAEQRALPELAHTQVRAVETASGWVDHAEQMAVSGQEKYRAGVTSVRLRIASATGLQIDGLHDSKKN